MTYKEQCIEQFMILIEAQNIPEYSKEVAKQMFVTGFDYGSMNGASDDIKQSVVKNMNQKQEGRWYKWD
ncbi:hypothetical protein F4V43_01880 [Paenibacillus spiritus]|uniref:Uncharacterized protein n=1 Tax=Paenibacillus spiritus TaxID=2496557 RepID=A0A5J5GGX1_9BACL|nr:hypothetical protein [Paenibacillus spiritus]KAA9007260.1 hypothetical protein F4V43_01880 [Paenibacillus spiritus]